MERKEFLKELQTIQDKCIAENASPNKIEIIYYLTNIARTYLEIIQSLTKLFHDPKNDKHYFNYLENTTYFYSVQKITENKNCSDKLKLNLQKLIDLDRGDSIMSDDDTLNDLRLKKSILKALKNYQESYTFLVKLWLEEIKRLNIECKLIKANSDYAKIITEHIIDKKDNLRQRVINTFQHLVKEFLIKKTA